MTTIEYFFSSRLKIDFPSSESTKLEFKNEIQTRQVGLNFFSRAKQKFFPLEPVQGFNGCLHFPYHLLWPTNYIISRHYFLLLQVNKWAASLVSTLHLFHTVNRQENLTARRVKLQISVIQLSYSHCPHQKAFICVNLKN